ncbi:MAG: hypothetical protein WBY44_11600 [Bryobacteraceae bacterium]
MFFRKQDSQRMDLEASKAGSVSAPPGLPPQANPFGVADPAKTEAVKRKAEEILESGRIPDCLFLCGVGNGILTLVGGPREKPVLLLFSTVFAAADYLRATGAKGTPIQLKAENLPRFAQSWAGIGVRWAALDRCPRCPQNPCLTVALEPMTKWTAEDFAKLWAGHRAARLVLGEIRVRSAMQHKTAGDHAAALIDLEYVRDHFDCGVPYLHQMIWLYAANDESARRTAADRLKEFGQEFDIPAEPSAKTLSQFMATAMVGLLAYFGILNTKP